MNGILEKIKAFATDAHGNQKRKFTNESYIIHPIRVMDICKHYTDNFSILAAALLHDVLEDTNVSESVLQEFLEEVTNAEEANRTLNLVLDLTDVYIKEDFPNMNRRKRKNKEAERLQKVDPDAQTVKYADIIDNAIDITKHDKNFALKFLNEVRFLLTKMDKGNNELYERAKVTVSNCLKELKKINKVERKGINKMKR